MKKLLIALLVTTELFSLDLDFSLPPVLEEIFEPSVLGEEIQKPQKRIEPAAAPDEEVTTIYVEPEEVFIESAQMEYNSAYPKIAFLVPANVVGKYANTISDSILSYLVFRDTKFQFELFNAEDESAENILKQLDAIRHKGYQLVVAAVTQKGARIIAKNEFSMQVYIPTINKKEINLQSDNISFGGIDYEEQIDRLLSYSAEKVAIFGDTSALSRRLENYVDNASFSDIAYRKVIKNMKVNLGSFIKKNHKLKNASVFLNMPMVKASLLASQLNVNDAGHKNVLLTQICYNPLLFTLTQQKDRSDMYIANSIDHTDFTLKDINLILGTNVDFSWVNYSSLIGVDFLVRHYIDDGYEKLFSEKMVNNQIKYNIEILKPSKSRFEAIRNDF